jgi:Pyruvate/2-oxoacid:ferredoxin oxidoreductase delta subunit
MKQSTKALFRMQGGWGIKSIYRFLHGYWYLINIHRYLNVLFKPALFVINHFPPIFGRFVLNQILPYYHGKIMRTEDVKKVVNLNVDLLVEDQIAEKVVPFETARNIIIENPDHIVIVDCACRLFKGEGYCSSEKYGIKCCMIIGEPMASFVLDHSQSNPLKITAEEALACIEDFHQLGWAHSMFFKDVFAERSYAICNCCGCCCVGLKINREIVPALQYPHLGIVSSGYVAQTDDKKCMGCNLCTESCPLQALTFNEAKKKVAVISDKCLGCGVCVEKCTENALSLVADPRRGMPLDVDVLQNKGK